MIIDFHAHAFPDALAGRALNTLKDNAARNANIYGDSFTYTDGTYSGLAASSADAGIGLSIVMPIATAPKSSEKLNLAAADADKIPGLRSFGSVNPLYPGSVEELSYIHELGLAGIKLHPDYQDCFVDSRESIAVIRRARELGLVILLHAGEDIGFTAPFHCTPDRILRMVDAVGADGIVLAHMGGYRLWREVLAKLPETGLYIDTSNSIEAFRDEWSVFAELIHAFGAERVLFGTDSPWAPQDKTLADTKSFLAKHGFNGEQADGILGGNSARLLTPATLSNERVKTFDDD